MQFNCKRIWEVVPAGILSAMLLSSCAAGQYGKPSSELAIAEISVATAREDTTLPLLPDDMYPKLAGNSEADAVRWGGTIATVLNLEDQKTLLEVVSRPLRNSGRPLHNDKTSGRFMAVVQTFLDPEIIKPGRDITVTGSLIGRRSGQIGESDYVFAVVQVENYTYWKKQIPTPPRHFPHWSPHSNIYRDPFFSPGGVYRPAPAHRP